MNVAQALGNMPSNNRRDTNNKQQKQPHKGVVVTEGGGSNINNISSNNAFISNLINLSIMAADTKDDDNSSSPSSSSSSNSESANQNQQKQQKQQQKQQEQSEAALPTFITNLTIKSPRQKTSSSNNSSNTEQQQQQQQLKDVTISLPPLRPEEPVASIRSALSEVLGFAHLTNYRLVVEPSNSVDNTSALEETSGGGSMKTEKKKSAATVKNNNGKNKNNKKKQQDVLWSPYTLRNADVTISPSLKSLESLKQPLPPSSSAKSASDSNSKEHPEEEEELVLDDYGDLSILLSLLSDNNNNNTQEAKAEKDPSSSSTTPPTTTTARSSINLNASHLCIRVVLETYNVSSIKDHVNKLQHLLVEGNVPFIDTLTPAAAAAADDDGSSGEVDADANKVVDKNGEDADGKKEDVNKPKNNNEKKQTQEEIDEQTKEAIAAALPSYTSNYDILFDNVIATTSSSNNNNKGGGGCDLTNFYYYACGEEQTLLELQQMGSEKNDDGGKSGELLNGSSNVEGWMNSTTSGDDQQQQKKNKKNKNKKNKKSSKNSKGENNNHNVKVVDGGSSSSGSENEGGDTAQRNNNAAATTNATNGSSRGSSSNNPKSSSTAQYFLNTERQLYNLNAQSSISITIRLSGYHPPPTYRQVLGDLAYIEAIMPDGQIVHVTAISNGFYVNKSTNIKFDPTPDLDGSNSKDACYSHALLDTLLQKSKSFRVAYSTALQASKDRNKLIQETSAKEETLFNLFKSVASSYPNNSCGVAQQQQVMGGGGGLLNSNTGRPSTFTPKIDTVVTRPTWLVPLPSIKLGDMIGPKESTYNHSHLHSYNSGRMEEELGGSGNNLFYGMDVRGGGLRDWNEELQTARELSVGTFAERIDRARLVHKVLSDFGEAALQGVKAIIDGYILPMNPNEHARGHVYLHNNIFFSRAIDTGLDTFKIIQGDAAAKKSASRDCHNMGVLHRLDMPGLHTLATVLVEYMGSRIVCQSVVPGILHGEKSHSLLYGAVETLSALQCNDEMHKLLESSIGEGCMVATRSIPSHPLTDERMDVIKKHRITPLSEVAVEEEEKKKVDGGGDAKDKSIQVCGPMEMKGILGSDKRKYVLDCTRLTPRDANWVSKDCGGTGMWEDNLNSARNGVKSHKLIPSTLDDDEWTVCVLRPELINLYAESKIQEYLVKNKKKKDEEEEETKENEEEVPAEASKDDGDKQAAAAADGEKEWVDIEPTGEKEKVSKKDDDSTKKPEEAKADSVHPIAKVEEEYIRSLRYNVNVFLPFTRSIEIIDEESHEILKQDEEEARQIARYLWDVAIPNLTKAIRTSSGTALQLPSDGKALTEMLHIRGINCRYLGRLAELARKEELEDIISFEKATAAAALTAVAANSTDAFDKLSSAKQYKAPRFCMPICWLELLECEMVARAAKHVIDAYILEQQGTSSQSTAHTIASVLSAIMSVGEESAGETELRTTSKQGNNGLDLEEMNALTLDLDDTGAVASSSARGREEIWSDIEREIGRRYRYTLSLYNTTSSSSKKGDTGESRALYMPLLRRICQRSGIRLVAKQYDLGKKCVCGGSGTSYPIAPTDILDILPLVKYAASVAGESFTPCSFSGSTAAGGSTPTLHVLLEDAKNMYAIAHANLSNQNFAVTLDYAQEGAAMYQRVLDSPLHPQVSKCLRLTAIAHLHKDEPELALGAASKYLAITISLHGFDSAEVLQAHLTMVEILFGVGKIADGVKHLRAAQFLMSFLGGKNYSGLSREFYRMGSHYYEAGKLEDALRFYKAAASRRNEDRMFDCLIARNTAGVLASLGKFKEAFDYEKKAHQLYLTFLGEDHEQTKASSNSLVGLMRYAVEQKKKSEIEEKERVKANAAESVADQIRADEEAREAKPKKKKKQNKKKGKK